MKPVSPFRSLIRLPRLTPTFRRVQGFLEVHPAKPVLDAAPGLDEAEPRIELEVFDHRLVGVQLDGLQPERTSLSWVRTSLAIAVNALLALRAGLVAGEPALLAVGVLLFAAAGAAVVVGLVRRRQLMGELLTITPPRGVLVGVALITLIASASGVASILVEGRP